MINACQARQLAQFAPDRSPPTGRSSSWRATQRPAGEPTVTALEEDGFVDTHLDAGNLECDKETRQGVHERTDR